MLDDGLSAVGVSLKGQTGQFPVQGHKDPVHSLAESDQSKRGDESDLKTQWCLCVHKYNEIKLEL